MLERLCFTTCEYAWELLSIHRLLVGWCRWYVPVLSLGLEAELEASSGLRSLREAVTSGMEGTCIGAWQHSGVVPPWLILAPCDALMGPR